MSNYRILYVTSEINPFLELTEVAEFVHALPQAMQEKGMEIRILMPRFGLINERRNRLHEVVRLSGINIAVGEDEKPLIIKVASIPNAKLQVYFIDNDDYFHRRHVFTDEENNFFADNDERAIFFCKGVLETVKKLGWSPDIVHCTDWMSSLIPLYLKTTYKDDPIYKHSKSVFSVFDEVGFDHIFNQDIIQKALHDDVNVDMLLPLHSADYKGFIKMGTQYADAVVNSKSTADLTKLLESENCKEIHGANVNEETVEEYFKLYSELLG